MRNDLSMKLDHNSVFYQLRSSGMVSGCKKGTSTDSGKKSTLISEDLELGGSSPMRQKAGTCPEFFLCGPKVLVS